MRGDNHQSISVLPANRAAAPDGLSAMTVAEVPVRGHALGQAPGRAGPPVRARAPVPADETTPDLLPDGPIRPDGPAGDPRGELALAREIRAREMVAGRSPAQIAAVIQAECGPRFCTTWIRAYRLALGIALADVVAQVRAWYAAEGRKAPRFSETLLSAYESGQKRPGPEYLHYLCAVYRADPRDLGYDGGCFCGRPHGDPAPPATDSLATDSRATGSLATDSRPTGSPAAPLLGTGPAGPVPGPAAVSWAETTLPDWPPAPRPGAAVVRLPDTLASMPGPRLAPPSPAERGIRPGGPSPGHPGAGHLAAGHLAAGDPGASAEATGQGDILRGMLLRLLANSAAAADSQFFGAVEHVRRDLDEALLRRSVSVSMLDQWEETTAGYGARYMSVPPLRLLCDVLLDLGDVRRMCAQRQPIDCAERLCRLAAQLAGLVGIIMIDLGDQRLARSYFRTARTAADETGDRRLRAWVAVRESLVPLYYGDPREAAALARTATDLAGRNRCVAGIMSRAVEARALARLAGRGRREALNRARTVFDQAQETLSELPADACADTVFGYTERQLAFHAGDALAALGDGQGGMRSFSRALRLYPPAEFLDRSLVLFGEARSLVEAGEPGQALGIGQRALVSLPREHRTELVLLAARGLGVAVAAQHPSLPALRDYSEALRTGLSPAGPAGAGRYPGRRRVCGLRERTPRRRQCGPRRRGPVPAPWCAARLMVLSDGWSGDHTGHGCPGSWSG
jgi:tetratricopeptide (TPR) repeat protein